jgi:arylsulfatase A-like enzyme
VGRVDRLTSNVDLTATLLDLAGAKPCRAAGECRRIDGRSFAPLLDGRDSGWPNDRAVPLEGGADAGPCWYRGLRTERDVFLRTVADAGGGKCEPTGATEYYDLESDPGQLHDLADGGAPPRRIEALEARLERLQRCSGMAGREQQLPDVGFCE